MSVDQQVWWRKKLRIEARQNLFFTSIQYGTVYHLQSGERVDSHEFFAHNSILLVSGVAQPKIIERYMREQAARFTHLAFGDHHTYTAADYATIRKHYNEHTTKILTTEKDAQKLLDITKGKLPVYVLPIAPHFLGNTQRDFETQLMDFVSNR
jgi:tetraacyldisaccharide 4'-kinase